MSYQPSVKVIACVCPKCGNELDGLQTDRVFTCHKCMLAVSLSEPGCPVYPMEFAASDSADQDSLIYLPAWVSKIKLDCQSSNEKQLEKVRKIELTQAVIMACDQYGLILYSDMSQLYTRAQAKWQIKPAKQRLVGCRRTFNQVTEVIETLLLMIIDRKVDVTGLKISISMSDQKLVGFPFTDIGMKLKDGILGHEILKQAFPDLATISSYDPQNR